MMKKILISAIIFTLISTVFAETKEPDLDKGELAVSSSQTGKYREATAIGVIDAPADIVWGIITDYESHPEFMPMQKSSKILRREGNTAWVKMLVDVGPAEINITNKNIQYIAPDKRTMTWDQDKGPFTLNSGKWIVEPYKKNKTKLTYTSSLAYPLLPNSLAEKLIKDSFPKLFKNFRKRASDVMNAKKKG